MERIYKHNQLLAENLEYVGLEINILHVIVAQDDLRKHFCCVFSQKKLIHVLIKLNLWASKKIVKHFYDDMLVVLEVHPRVLEQGINHHDVEVLFEGPIVHYLVIVAANVVQNEGYKNLHFWIFLDNSDHY